MAGITYGGVKLAAISASLALRIETEIEPRDVYEWCRPRWPVRLGWPSGAQIPRQPIRLGTLHWPVGASLWATAWVLMTSRQLQKVRVMAYDSSSAYRYRSLPFTLDDGRKGKAITTNLFMLPPRPLSQITGANGLYLVPLVDDRFLWWQCSAVIDVTQGTTWAELLEEIGEELGIEIEPDDIEDEYLSPPGDLASQYGYLPPLLDAVCASIGHRLVRKLDGTVITQAARTALASQDAQEGAFKRQKGGKFAFRKADFSTAAFARQDLDGPSDLQSLVPRQVDVVFPRLDQGGSTTGPPHVVSVTLTSLALTEYGAAPGHAGTEILGSSAAATYTTTGGSTPSNATQITALGRQIAKDWYLWQLGRQHTRYAGIVPYVPEGYSEVEWSQRQGDVSTRVLRWIDTQDTQCGCSGGGLHHAGSGGSVVELIHNGGGGGGGGGGELVMVHDANGTPELQTKVPVRAGGTITAQGGGSFEPVRPPTPSVTPTRSKGSTAWQYAVSIQTRMGESTAGGAGGTAVGAGTLTPQTPNMIRGEPPPGAEFINIIRTSAPGTPNTTGRIAQITPQQFREGFLDTGLPVIASTPTEGHSGDVALMDNIRGGVNVIPLEQPDTLTATLVGPAGSTSRTYKLTALDANGDETTPSTGLTVANGPSALSATNHFVLRGTPRPGARLLNLYRTTSGGTPSSTGRIAQVTPQQLREGIADTGLAGDSSTPPAANTTGQILADGSPVSGGGGVSRVFTENANVNNTSTTETDLYTETIPANTLTTNNDMLVGEYELNATSGALNIQVFVYYPDASTQIFASATIAVNIATGCNVRFTILRVTSSTARVQVTLSMRSKATVVNVESTETDLTGLDFTSSQTMKLTGLSSAGSNNLTAKFGWGEKHPA